jgi:hypothetical protein
MRLLVLVLGLCGWAGAAGIERTWLGYETADPSRVVVCWETAASSDSAVEFGATGRLGQVVRKAESVTRHRVAIPAPLEGPWHYRVKSGVLASEVAAVRGYERGVLRVVVVGDLGYAKQEWAQAVLRESPHLLLSAGDNVPQLHGGDSSAFAALIAKAPELFRSTPFLSVLGNHDREVRPRGPKPPAEPVYDVEATAFRGFFALPGDGIDWTFDLPAFGVRFVGVDLNHTSDFGTTWQTCNDFRAGSKQLEWYRRVMAESPQPFVVTVYNEQHRTVRKLAGGAWWTAIAQGSASITGFGYFAERAVVEGLPCYNTSVSGKGDRYPDPASAFLASEDNYMLLTFEAGRPMRVELKSLAGTVLDRSEVSARKR